MAAGGEQARRGVIEHQVRRRRQRRSAAQLHQAADVAQLVEADEAVDLRDLAGQLVAVAVDHAAGDQHATSTRSTPLPLRPTTSRIASIDSCLASSMKAQVLITTVSALPRSPTTS